MIPHLSREMKRLEQYAAVPDIYEKCPIILVIWSAGQRQKQVPCSSVSRCPGMGKVPVHRNTIGS